MKHLRLILAVVLMAGLSAPAWAHAQLRAASPAVGSTVSQAPGEVAITYSEGVEPSFSTIEVTDAMGMRVDRADPHNGPDGKTRLIVTLKPLAAGVYTVTWSAISVDTHHTQGRFTFTVAP